MGIAHRNSRNLARADPAVGQQRLPERRPLASRDRAVSKAVAHWLAVKGLSPNAISMAGMPTAIRDARDRHQRALET